MTKRHSSDCQGINEILDTSACLAAHFACGTSLIHVWDKAGELCDGMFEPGDAS
jgi:hypothetical protein